MALKPCKECGGQVSTEAKNCPHCGKQLGHAVDISKIGCLPLVIFGIFSALVIAKIEDCTSQKPVDKPEVSSVPNKAPAPPWAPAAAAPQTNVSASPPPSASSTEGSNTATAPANLDNLFGPMEVISNALEQYLLGQGLEVTVKPGVSANGQLAIVFDCTKESSPQVVCHSLYNTFALDREDRKLLKGAHCHSLIFRYENGLLSNGEYVRPIQ